jgi:hypothetical protein
MTDRSSSPLRHLDISDDAVARDIAAEKARELVAAYERIEQLQYALKGLLLLIETIKPRLSDEVRTALRTERRIIDAMEMLR